MGFCGITFRAAIIFLLMSSKRVSFNFSFITGKRKNSHEIPVKWMWNTMIFFPATNPLTGKSTAAIGAESFWRVFFIQFFHVPIQHLHVVGLIPLYMVFLYSAATTDIVNLIHKLYCQTSYMYTQSTTVRHAWINQYTV